MLEYGTAKILPRHMNSVLVESRDAFKVSTGKIVRDSFMKTKLLPLSPLGLTTNTQACAASVQISSVPNTTEINGIAHHTVAPIGLE